MKKVLFACFSVCMFFALRPMEKDIMPFQGAWIGMGERMSTLDMIYYSSLVPKDTYIPQLKAAIKNNDIVCAKSLITQNPHRINEFTEKATPLYLSIMYERDELTEFLLKMPTIDANVGTNDLTSPLTLTAWHCDIKMCKKLLDHGADPNKKGYLGRTPFELAAKNSMTSSKILTIMLKHGAKFHPISLVLEMMSDISPDYDNVLIIVKNGGIVTPAALRRAEEKKIDPKIISLLRMHCNDNIGNYRNGINSQGIHETKYIFFYQYCNR